MPLIGAVPKTQKSTVTERVEESSPRTVQIDGPHDSFDQATPVWWGRCDVKAPRPILPTWALDDYDTPQKQREILNRNGIVGISSLGGTSWPSFEHLPALRKYVENLDEPRYFLTHLTDNGIEVESFKMKADWLLRIFACAPQLDRSQSILNAVAQSKEAQLECLDTLIHGKVVS